MSRKTGTWKILHLVALSIFLLASAFFVVDGSRALLLGQAAEVGGEFVLFHQLTGTTWTELQATYPGVANAIDLVYRVLGTNSLIIGILVIAVLLTGFRKGERRAWYMMWVFPLFSILIFLLHGTRPATDPAFRSALWIWLVLPFVALAISYRTFFPGQEQEQARPA